MMRPECMTHHKCHHLGRPRSAAAAVIGINTVGYGANATTVQHRFHYRNCLLHEC